MKKYQFPAMYLVFIIGLLSCQSEGKQKVEAVSDSETVNVFILKLEKVSKKIRIPAELLPYERAELHAKVEGFLKEVSVDIGDGVKKGQLLATLDAPEVKARYAEAKASLQAAKAKYQTSMDQWKRISAAAKTQGVIAAGNLEQTHNQMLNDSASYEAARSTTQAYLELQNYLNIRAPFDGIVIARETDPGDLVGANTLIVTVENADKLRLRVPVPEMYVSGEILTDEIEFSTEAYPSKTFKATLSRKSQSIDPETRTETWEFLYDNKESILKSGMFSYATLEVSRGDGIFALPYSSMVTNLERNFVIRVKNNKTEWIDVKQGMSFDKRVEVLGNLQEGDTLFVRGSEEYKPGYQAAWHIQTSENL